MTTINDLCVSNSFSPDDKIPMWSNANGVTRALPLSVLTGQFLTQDSIAEFAASPAVETFASGAGFTPGSTTKLTLANQYLSTANIEVYFDASYQGPEQYTLVGYMLSFISPIPIGVQNVYVKGGATRITGAPSDGTVTDAKVASGSKIYSHINSTASLTQFGAVGDWNGTTGTDNSNAILLAEASSFERIYVPEGTYYLASPSVSIANTMLKKYHGPGKFVDYYGGVSAGTLAHRTTSLNPPATVANSAGSGYFTGDLKYTDIQHHILGPGIRDYGLDMPYFCSQVTPEWKRYDNYGGNSGTACILTSAVSAGAMVLPVSSTIGGVLQVGQTIGVLNLGGIGTLFSGVIAAMTNTTITLSLPLTVNLPIYSQVTLGARTQYMGRYQELNTYGGGDAYCNLGRIIAGYPYTAGQTHFYHTSTSGYCNGDVTAIADHNYLQTMEWQFSDLGHDVAVINQVQTFFRTNNTAALHEVWIDRIANSAGSKPCDAGYIMSGKWKKGLDFSMADFTSFGNCAIGLATGHAVYWNMSQNDPTNLFPLGGNVLGSTFDNFDGLYRNFWVGGTRTLTLDANGNAAVPQGGKFQLGGPASNTYLFYDGTNIYLFKNGSIVASW